MLIRCMVIMFCVLLSSCTKHQSPQQKNNIDQQLIDGRKKVLDIIIQQEAMLVDVPIPLYDERIIPCNDSSIESDTWVFGYKSPLSCAQAQDFFMHQMDRYGWQHRYCTVIIKKSDHNSLHSRIFIYIKKSENR